MRKEKNVVHEMPFLSHLEIFRWHIIRGVASIFIFALGAFFNKKFIFHHIILAPTRIDFCTYKMMHFLGKYFNIPFLCVEYIDFTLQNRKMAGQFILHITTSFFIGFLLAFPYIFWELWCFVKPGLQLKSNSMPFLTIFVSILFFLGLLFGYFLLIPIVINFLSHYRLDDSVINEFDITSYLSTFTTLILSCGFIFQLPILIYFLAQYKLISIKVMKSYRKHAIVGSLIVGAFLTPPDIISQLLVAFPLIILYELSIYMVKYLVKKKDKYANPKNSLRK